MKERNGQAPSIRCPHCEGSGRLLIERTTIGDMILAARKKSGLTQDELSKKVLLSRAQVANIESGRSDLPMKTLQRFADAFGCSLRDLIPG